MKDSIKGFIHKNPPPSGWIRNFRDHFPPAGEVPKNVPIIRVVDDGGKLIFVLCAHEVCCEENLKECMYCTPNGLHSTWGDLVLELSEHMLANRIVEKLMGLGSEIPASWRIEFGWLHNELVSEFKFK